MGHREKYIGHLRTSIYWHRDIIGLGVEIKWVRRHYVEAWILLPMLSLGLTYDLSCGRSLEEMALDPKCWEDE